MDNGRVMEVAQKHVVQEHIREVEHVIHQLQSMEDGIVHHFGNQLKQDRAAMQPNATLSL